MAHDGPTTHSTSTSSSNWPFRHWSTAMGSEVKQPSVTIRPQLVDQPTEPFITPGPHEAESVDPHERGHSEDEEEHLTIISSKASFLGLLEREFGFLSRGFRFLLGLL